MGSKDSDQLEVRIKLYTKFAMFLVALGLVVSILGLSKTFAIGHWKWLEPDELGSFLSGSVGVLWSLAGLVWIYIAFLGQRQQLMAQYSEIEANRHEINRSRFESTLFQLMNRQNEIVSTLFISQEQIRDKSITSNRGRVAFKLFYTLLKDSLKGEFDLDTIKNSYLAFYEEHEHLFGSYFRHICLILGFIDSSAPDEDREFYITALRDQLSTYELLFIFYNCVGDPSAHGCQKLIEKYSLLKNLARTKLIESSHETAFSKSAYE